MVSSPNYSSEEQNVGDGSREKRSLEIEEGSRVAPVIGLLPACDKEADGPHYLIVGNSHSLYDVGLIPNILPIS